MLYLPVYRGESRVLDNESNGFLRKSFLAIGSLTCTVINTIVMFEGLSTVATTPLVLEWMDQTAQTTFRYVLHPPSIILHSTDYSFINLHLNCHVSCSW